MTQQLATLAPEIGLLRRRPPASVEKLAEEMKRLGDPAMETSVDARRLSHEIHPATLEPLGLAAALKSHCEELNLQQEIHAELIVEVLPLPIPRHTSNCLCRIAQESLRNAAKYSGAQEIQVSPTSADGGVRLSVTDRGRGFDMTEARGKAGQAGMDLACE